MDANNINVIALAYLGDSVYEVYIRKMLIDKGYVKVDDMQKKAVLQKQLSMFLRKDK